jgi:hypothetical protein
MVENRGQKSEIRKREEKILGRRLLHSGMIFLRGNDNGRENDKETW